LFSDTDCTECTQLSEIALQNHSTLVCLTLILYFLKRDTLMDTECRILEKTHELLCPILTYITFVC